MTDPSRLRGDFALLARLLRMARAYWPLLAGIFVLSLLAPPIALLVPLPLKIAVDSGIGTDPLPGFLVPFQISALSETANAILLAAVFVLVIGLASQLQHLGHGLLRAYTKERLALDFRSRLFDRLQRLSHIYHDKEGTSDAIYRVQYDAPALQQIAIDGVTPLVTAAFTVAGMLYVTFMLDWQLALLAVGVCPLLFVAIRSYHHRLRSQWREVRKLDGEAMGVVQEVLTSLRVVKAFGQEEREQDRYVNRVEETVSARMRVELSRGMYGFIVNLATALGTASVLFLGAHRVSMEVITIGELLIIMSYLAQLYSPLKTIGEKVTGLQNAFVSAERVLDILDHPLEIEEKEDAKPIARARGTFELEAVAFSYEAGRSTLEDITLTIPAGSRVGIAGHTGAGKTTLVNLLLRFHDPVRGRIMLDGVELRDYRLVDLRKQFAVVLQDPVLFSTTIGENIAYARPDASMEEIIQAARTANIHDFVMSLPERYDTLVGERGLRLSGGERQRVSLARAFLKDAPILILDEPTSSVDVKTESAIMDAMERLMAGRTTFMIAHRLSTLSACDLLIVLSEGRLAEFTAATDDHPSGDGSSSLAATLYQ